MRPLLLALTLCATLPAQLLYPAGQWNPPGFTVPPAGAVYQPAMNWLCQIQNGTWNGLVPLRWSHQECVDASFPWWPDPTVWADTKVFLFASSFGQAQPMELLARLDIGGPAAWVPEPTGLTAAMPGGLQPGVYGIPPLGVWIELGILVQHWSASPAAPWLNWSVGPVTVWIP